jgi:hypothetical protein
MSITTNLQTNEKKNAQNEVQEGKDEGISM